MKRTIMLASALCAIAIAVLPGCAALDLVGDAATVRVTEYGVAGMLSGSAVGGCEVRQSEGASSAAGKSSMSVTLLYQGQKCSVKAQSK